MLLSVQAMLAQRGFVVADAATLGTTASIATAKSGRRHSARLPARITGRASPSTRWYDAVAGAALGFGSAELTWWLSDKLLPSRNVAVGVSGNAVDVAITW